MAHCDIISHDVLVQYNTIIHTADCIIHVTLQ